MRQAFLNEMFRDQRVNDLWWTWGESTGLNEAAHNLASVGDQVADAAGLEHRGYVWDLLETASDDELSTFNNCLSDESVEAANAAFDLFVECLHEFHSHAEQLTDEATVFVRDTLQLPWPWLVLELLECFGYAVLGFATGRVMRFDGWAEDPEILAPEVNLEFKTLASETVSQALERLLETFRVGFVELSEPYENQSVPRGRLPTDHEKEFQEGVGKYARWFYRNRICGESISSMAQNDNYDRATIRRGIGEAERLLGLTQWQF